MSDPDTNHKCCKGRRAIAPDRVDCVDYEPNQTYIPCRERMPNDTYVLKWRNSLAVRIPRGIAREARLAAGDRLTLNLAADGSMVLRSDRRKYELRELVSRITTRDRHSETDWGKPAGQEAW